MPGGGCASRARQREPTGIAPAVNPGPMERRRGRIGRSHRFGTTGSYPSGSVVAVVEGDWTLVVPIEDGIEDRAEVDRLLAQWLTERGLSPSEVDPGEIRLDLFNVRDRPCQFRVWVRTSVWPGSPN